MTIIDVGAKVKFDSSIFTATFPDCCDCSKCSFLCCEAGAIITLEERNVILSKKEQIIPLVTDKHNDPDKWFAPPDDEDFTRVGEEPTPEKKAKWVGTGNGKGFCNLFNPEFGCAVQQLAVKEGKHKWAYKPHGCILYPLYQDENDVIRPDENLDGQMWCSIAANHRTSVFRACRQEIEFVAGPEAYRKLAALEPTYIKHLSLKPAANPPSAGKLVKA